MQIDQNISLKPFNTFGINVEAHRFLRIAELNTLQKTLRSGMFTEYFVLSGGSNLLLTRPVEELVLYMDVQGREILQEDEKSITIRIMCGENWHDLVLWTLNQGYGGLENLALIPGRAGTAPVQNIGAYGVELKDVLKGLEAVEMSTGELVYFDAASCKLGYRESIFKKEARGKYIIWSIDLHLSKTGHVLKTDYGDIRSKLNEAGVSQPKPMDVAQAIIGIRKAKLPDPAVLGNSGSFFKNPVIPREKFESLKVKFPEIPGYPQDSEFVKIPAGWLIEKLGYKGYRIGDAGVHEIQSLVLVNYGDATGKEILNLAQEIQAAVFDNFSVKIEPEVNIY